MSDKQDVPHLWLDDETVIKMGRSDLLRRSRPTTSKDIDELIYIHGGRSARPTEPICIFAWDGATPIMIAGMGQTEMAEIGEIALASIEKANKEYAATGHILPWADIRERRGSMRKELVADAMGDAFDERAAQHRRNPISDPAPEITVWDYTNRKLYY